VKHAGQWLNGPIPITSECAARERNPALSRVHDLPSKIRSPLILETTTVGLVKSLQKAHALHSFWTFQEASSMMRDAKDFILVPLTKLKSSHQSLTNSKLSQVKVSTEIIPCQEKIEFQILGVYRRLKGGVNMVICIIFERNRITIKGAGVVYLSGKNYNVQGYMVGVWYNTPKPYVTSWRIGMRKR
jgi:hypothetical protein